MLTRGEWRARRVCTISSADLYDRTWVFGAAVRRKSLSSKEKLIWVIGGDEIRAKRNNRRRP
jgi:hypothetical protein